MIGWRKKWRGYLAETAATAACMAEPNVPSEVKPSLHEQTDDLDNALAAVLTLAPQSLARDGLLPSLFEDASST